MARPGLDEPAIRKRNWKVDAQGIRECTGRRDRRVLSAGANRYRMVARLRRQGPRAVHPRPAKVRRRQARGTVSVRPGCVRANWLTPAPSLMNNPIPVPTPFKPSVARALTEVEREATVRAEQAGRWL